MSGNQKLLAGLVIGVAAGAALALFLSSEKGKALLEKVKDTGGKLTDDTFGQWKDSLDDLLKKGTDLVAEMEEKYTANIT